MGGPIHCLPLLDGVGLLHFLILVLKQLLSHLPQSPHPDQPPSTKMRGTISDKNSLQCSLLVRARCKSFPFLILIPLLGYTCACCKRIARFKNEDLHRYLPVLECFVVNESNYFHFKLFLFTLKTTYLTSQSSSIDI